MMRTLGWVPALLFFTVLAYEADGQTSVTQGEDASQPKAERLKSPMLLDTPLDLDTLLASNQWVEMSDMRHFICEGVSLPRLRVRARRFSDSSIELNVMVFVYNEAGHDKWAHVDLGLMVGNELVASDRTWNIDAEELTTRKVRASLAFPANKIKDPVKAILKMTVRVTDEQISRLPANYPLQPTVHGLVASSEAA